MATWGAMKARIADELARSDLTSPIAEAMKSAVRFYHWSERFWLAETTATFSAVASQEWYTDAQTGYALLYMSAVDTVRVTDGTDRFQMVKVTYAELDEMAADTDTESKPLYYAIYANQVRMFPIPDAAYTITVAFTKADISAGFRTFPYSGSPPTGIDDTSPQDLAEGFWTTEAEELIRSRAKADLFENVIRDFAEADRMRGREREVLAMLRRVADQRNGSGFVRAHCL